MTGHLAERLDAFVDGELDTVALHEAELHLASCAVCSRQVASRRALSGVIRGSLPRFTAPESVTRMPVTRTPVTRRPWMGLAAAVALIAAAGIGGYDIGRRQADASGMREAVVSSHIRSLLASHLTDVTSSDRHTVKPWFTGVLDFAPTVVDLSAQGFPLIGGRLDYIAGHRVPALVYTRNRHVINLFQWPTTRGDVPIGSSVDNGYNVLHWVTDHTEYWMISDLNDAELRQCAVLIH
ncbi:MAG TPA: anti-sigma factor [Gemmatimonadaceae bacterium]|jgi:anti-sigma factor RsiW|nr:anti-sigma factor [Gemmatimonadaceae bacterium]